jgi:SWI/SNF-related matrix-associated actin-dependent regulator 1 of chromatin subfamily A
MPTPLPHQLEGAKFLADRKAALLADAPRVGKTGASIVACDLIFARNIVVVTKASARAQWGKEFEEWGYPRNIQVIYRGNEKVRPDAEVIVVGWGMIHDWRVLWQLVTRRWDVLILDESHEAKNPQAKRTKAVYTELRRHASHVWCLSGTPIANAPNDLYAMLYALDSARIKDTLTYDQFLHRYCVTRKKYVGGRWIEYAIKGKNEDVLKERLAGFWLRRTQKDVGIRAPLYTMLYLHVDELPPEMAMDETNVKLFESIEAGIRLTGEDELHLGTLRRLTGQIKAPAIVGAAKDALDDGLDKLVIMAWHTDVVDAIKSGLSGYGVVGIDGRTSPTARHSEVQKFQNGGARVFVGQILAAGEAIDLSAACELWFAEASLVPKDMSQAALRVTNHTQTRQAFVRFCALEGSVDEALMGLLKRKVASIKLIMES